MATKHNEMVLVGFLSSNKGKWFTRKEMAEALGVSLYMARAWLNKAGGHIKLEQANSDRVQELRPDLPSPYGQTQLFRCPGESSIVPHGGANGEIDHHEREPDPASVTLWSADAMADGSFRVSGDAMAAIVFGHGRQLTNKED